MNNKILVRDVKDLGEGKFSVRLDLDTGSSETDVSQTQTLSADGYDAAVEIAKQDFSRWLKLVVDCIPRVKAATAQS